ncbi:Retrotransposon, unclassified-like protein [Senna tora]|uniref:Retrotransposon, unclassified-like protein n=1 Tax=Senna tora TaxID=362788 RepID=A0A834SPF9_9FABA|nr:Retrotransposon, unclassified-like protein [Senna tora]
MEPSSDNEQNMPMTNVREDKSAGHVDPSGSPDHPSSERGRAMGTRTRSETTPDRGCLDDADEQVKDDLLRQETDRDPSVECNDQKNDSDGKFVGTHFRERRRSNVGGDGSSRGKSAEDHLRVRDGNIELQKVNHQVTKADRKSGHFFVFHQSTTHPTEDCYQLRQIFQRRYKAGELEATTNVQNRPLPAHAVLGAGPLRIDEPREVEVIQSQEDNDNIVVAKGLAKSTNFRAFFDLLKFDEDAKAQAALSIVEIAQNMGGKRKAKHANHNRPLYVEAEIAGLKVRRAMVDGGSSVNIIPYSVLKKTNYPEHLMEKSVTSLGSFNGCAVKTMGAVTLNLKVGPFVTANKFYVIDSHPSYHILLGRPWIHSHDVVPSTLRQCVKSNYKGRDIEIPATRAPFDEDETHFVEALFFDEHAVNPFQHLLKKGSTFSITARLVLSSKVACTHSAQPLVTSALVAILTLLRNTSPLAIKAPSIVVITSRSLSVEVSIRAQSASSRLTFGAKLTLIKLFSIPLLLHGRTIGSWFVAGCSCSGTVCPGEAGSTLSSLFLVLLPLIPEKETSRSRPPFGGNLPVLSTYSASSEVIILVCLVRAITKQRRSPHR